MPKHEVPPRFRAGTLGCLIQAAKSAGVDPYDILRRRKVDPQSLEHSDAWLPATSVAMILEDLAASSGRDDFGVLLGHCRGVSPLGPIALLLAHEQSVRDIITTARELLNSITNALVLELSEESGTAVMKYELLVRPFSSQLADLIVSLGVKVLEDATGGRWHPAGVHFRHAAPRHEDGFRRRFGCAVFFDAEFNGWTCTSAELDTPTGAANGHLATIARKLLTSTSEWQQAPKVRDAVKAQIYHYIGLGRPTVKKIAGAMGMSARSIQRKLDQEGETFDAILNAVRHEIAEPSLALSHLPVTDVAYLTGFADPSAFSRWFKAEFHSTPSRWRAVHGQRPPGSASTELSLDA